MNLRPTQEQRCRRGEETGGHGGGREGGIDWGARIDTVPTTTGETASQWERAV